MYHQPDTLSSTEETLVSVVKIQQNKWKQAIVTKIKYLPPKNAIVNILPEICNI